MKIFLIAIVLFQMGCASTPQLSEFLKQKGYVAIPLKRNAVGHFELVARVNGIKGRFTLDTGASSTVIDLRQNNKFKLKKSIKVISAGGLGTSSKKASIKNLKKLRLGSYKLKNLQVTVMDLSHMNRALIGQGVQRQDGVIGADVLKKAQGVIDYKNNTLYLKGS